MKLALKEYTSTELCKKLGVSRAWIAKIEKAFKFDRQSSGLQGKKSSYDEFQFETFRRIDLLRRAGIPSSEIKRVRDMEDQKIHILLTKAGIKNESKAEVRHYEPYLVLDESTIGMNSNILIVGMGIEYDYTKYEKALKEGVAWAIQLKELTAECSIWADKTARRLSDYAKKFQEEAKIVKCQP